MGERCGGGVLRTSAVSQIRFGRNESLTLHPRGETQGAVSCFQHFDPLLLELPTISHSHSVFCANVTKVWGALFLPLIVMILAALIF